jgi:NAD(P)-dependent dehydrogenase (short-subunit alcohol dehydrogenase family)
MFKQFIHTCFPENLCRKIYYTTGWSCPCKAGRWFYGIHGLDIRYEECGKSTPYGTAKAALLHLIKVAAHELEPQDVRINAIAPAFVRTPRLLHMISPEHWQKLADHNPLKRVAMPAEVAATILFLPSDLANYVTGNGLILDGGLSNLAVFPEFSVEKYTAMSPY